MSQENDTSPRNQSFVKWAVILILVAALAWIGAYILGEQIYDALVRVIH